VLLGVLDHGTTTLTSEILEFLSEFRQFLGHALAIGLATNDKIPTTTGSHIVGQSQEGERGWTSQAILGSGL
jgi:hypothetical protein